MIFNVQVVARLRRPVLLGAVGFMGLAICPPSLGAVLSLANALQQFSELSQSDPTLEALSTQQGSWFQARERAAVQRPNPTLELSLEGIRRAPNAQSFALSYQPQSLALQEAKRGVIRAQATLARQQLAVQVAQHRLGLIVAYLETGLAQQRVSGRLQDLQLARQVTDAARKRYEAGRIAQIERDRIQLGEQQAQLSLKQAEQALQFSRQSLQNFIQAVGQPMQYGATLADSPPSLLEVDAPAATLRQLTRLAVSQGGALPLGSELAQAVQQSAQSQDALYAALVDQARAERHWAQAAMRLQPVWRLGIQHLSDQSSTTTQLVLGVSMPLPVFGRATARVQAAYAAEQLAHTQRLAAQRQRLIADAYLQSQIASTLSNYQSIAEDQLPRQRTLVAKYLIGFREGRFGIDTVHQARREALATQDIALSLLEHASTQSVAWLASQLSIAPDALPRNGLASWQAITATFMPSSGDQP